jgi:N-acetylglucosaminyl-diphospho-decaprenol L-rhamnosyltransferase
MAGPDVSIIVVNYRTPELTIRALADARRSAGDLSVEEVVVDNGSGDNSVEQMAAAHPEASLVALPDNRGFAGGVNAGIAASRGRHLLLLNSDAFAVDGAVERLVAYLDAHPRVGVVAPALEHEDGSLQNNAYRRFPSPLTLFFDFCFPLGVVTHGRLLHPHNLPNRCFDRPRRIAHAMGAVLLVRSEAGRQAGPLDEGFFLYLEETEWQRRVAAAGWEIHLEPGSRVRHLMGASGADGYAFASKHYLDSVDRYFGGARSARAAMLLGSAISLLDARVRGLLARDKRRYSARADACRAVISQLAP